jgi:hypothetical protein
MKAIYYILGVLLLSATLSCKKFVDVGDPKDQLATSVIFVNDASATAAVVGIYSDMNAFNYQFANVLTTFLGAMSADEFVYAATLANFDEFKNNSVLPGNQYADLLWSQPYNFIYRANAVIEGATASTTLSSANKNQVLGEARFIRAFCHFYLVNMFGDVPLILDTDVLKNTDKSRTPKAEVYAAIIEDLTEAKKLLVNDYPGNKERTRPNKAAAALLLARVYLYNDNFDLAEQEATTVINTPGYALLDNADPANAAHISKVFLKNSNEAVWQLQVVNVALGRNTWEGNTIVPVSSPLYRMTKDPAGLVPAFEAGDKRYANWVGKYVPPATPDITHYYPFKYKVRVGTVGVAPTEYSMVLRFAEAYLIRAEARMQKSKFGDGKDDLNVIRKRAGLLDLATPVSIPAGMLLVEKERRVELFAEWGHRWFDLKRWKSVTGVAGKTRADDILPATKPFWKSTAILFPIPTTARRTNNNLTPNPGYN